MENKTILRNDNVLKLADGRRLSYAEYGDLDAPVIDQATLKGILNNNNCCRNLQLMWRGSRLASGPFCESQI